MTTKPFHPPSRLLMGPGPSDVSPRVLQALASPMLGHLDPEFLRLMDAIQFQLRQVFQTENTLTLALPGTGSSGMEACVVNLLEPGDKVIVGVAGYFGERLAEVATRAGAKVVRIEAPWGEIVPEAAVIEAIRSESPAVVAIVHAETSTGVWQPVDRIALAARAAGALTVLDAVTSLGTIEVPVDEWGIDAAYSCSQKGLACPPGLSPVTFSERAVVAMAARRTPVSSVYLDMQKLARYWGPERVYHHTAPCSLFYALYEGLSMVLEEGLAARFARHRAHHAQLVTGLEHLGLRLLAPPAHQLPTLHAVRIPEGVDDLAIRRALLNDHGIEIGGGLGPLKGKIWRIGLMGEGSNTNHVLLLLAALRSVLDRLS
jgi:alanine-glyoxylate transaminase/serine-glyoxylate transaminase/serine-pyruvate transaminase